MRYLILILMAVMSISICTAGGLMHSETIHHTPRIEKYKLKKEKKERKLTRNQIAKIVIAVLLAGVLAITAIISIRAFNLIIYMLYFVSLSAMAFYPDVKNGTILIFFLLGIGVPLLWYSNLITSALYITALAFFVLYLISIALNNKKKNDSKPQ